MKEENYKPSSMKHVSICNEIYAHAASKKVGRQDKIHALNIDLLIERARHGLTIEAHHRMERTIDNLKAQM